MTRQPWTPDQTPDSFWAIIEKASRDQNKLREQLMTMAKGDIYEFDVYYDRLMSVLLDPPYVLQTESEDDASDFATWAVAQGKDYYFDLLTNPSKKPQTLPDKKGLGFVSMALRVYHDRFGEDLKG